MSSSSINDKQWVQHLLEFHRRAPGAASKFYSRFQTSLGLSSYELLAHEVSEKVSGISVLDLACGDGFQIPYLRKRLNQTSLIFGVDMSDAEIKRAREKNRDPNVSFMVAKAQQLPFADESLDTIVCHLSFRLFSPLSPVISELERVLKPHGIFSAVVGNPTGARGLFAELSRLTDDFLKKHLSDPSLLDAGDPRASSRKGWEYLFSGFAVQTEATDFETSGRIPLSEVWGVMEDYLVSLLPAPKKALLADVILAAARKVVGADGSVEMNFPLSLFTVGK